MIKLFVCVYTFGCQDQVVELSGKEVMDQQSADLVILHLLFSRVDLTKGLLQLFQNWKWLSINIMIELLLNEHLIEEESFGSADFLQVKPHD